MKGNPKLANLKDDDERLPIHWAVSYNHRPIVEILLSQRNFDPDVQDASGWTPLMIASSLREEDDLVDMLLRKDADVSIKNNIGQVCTHLTSLSPSGSFLRPIFPLPNASRRQPFTSQPPKTTSKLHRSFSLGVPLLALRTKGVSCRSTALLQSAQRQWSTSCYRRTVP